MVNKPPGIMPAVPPSDPTPPAPKDEGKPTVKAKNPAPKNKLHRPIPENQEVFFPYFMKYSGQKGHNARAVIASINAKLREAGRLGKDKRTIKAWTEYLIKEMNPKVEPKKEPEPEEKKPD